MTDEIALLRELRPPATGPDPALVATERAALMALLTEETTEVVEHVVQPDGGRRRRRRLVRRAGAVVVLTGTVAAASWAVLQRDPALSTELNCLTLDPVPVETGDPIADCVAAWREETGAEPPPLRTYADEHGNVYVLAADQEPLVGWTSLDGEFRQDVRIAQLMDEFRDVGRGFDSGCFTQNEAVQLVSNQFERLGLDNWTVRVDPQVPSDGPVAGPDTCATFVGYDDEPRQVVLRAISPGDSWDGPEEARELARSVYARMVTGPGQQCMTADEALDVARSEAERLGFDVDGPSIGFDTLEAPSGTGPTCVRPVVWVGGLVQVVLREVPLDQM